MKPTDCLVANMCAFEDYKSKEIVACILEEGA